MARIAEKTMMMVTDMITMVISMVKTVTVPPISTMMMMVATV